MRDRVLLIRGALFLTLALGISNVLVQERIDRGPIAHVREGIAQATAWVLTQGGLESTARGDRVHMPDGSVQIVNSCTGLDASLLLAVAVLVFPAAWGARAIGVLMSFAVLMSLNFVRVITLAYFINSRPDMFDFSHVYVWPAAVIVTSLATLLVWIQLVALREA